MVTIEVRIQPGTDLKTAFEESIELAKRIGVYVDFKFNGVHCGTGPYGNAENGVKRFHEAINGDEPRVAFSYHPNIENTLK